MAEWRYVYIESIWFLLSFLLVFLSFVRWIQFLAIGHVYPEYNIWAQFASDALATSIVPSALYDSHPIEIPITQSIKTNLIFDNIIYVKGFVFKRKYSSLTKICLGSNVIRFLHSYIGDETFRDGLTNYLNKYAYKNTRKENFLFYLSKASEQLHLTHILSIWTKQISYPFITVCLEIYLFLLTYLLLFSLNKGNSRKILL